MRCKLRFALPDVPAAVDAVVARVRLGSGIELQADLQEIEGGELVVEVSTDGAADARSVRQAVRTLAPEAEVLSVWREPVAGPAGRATEPSRSLDDGLPMVARRALESGIPTAAWAPADAGPADGWHLAVPVMTESGRPCVGLARRRGYSWRFTSLDVAALRSSLVV